MKRRLIFFLLVMGLLVLAVGGWAVQGLRFAALRHNLYFAKPS